MLGLAQLCSRNFLPLPQLSYFLKTSSSSHFNPPVTMLFIVNISGCRKFNTAKDSPSPNPDFSATPEIPAFLTLSLLCEVSIY